MQNGFFSINRRLIKRQIAALSYGLTLSLFSLASFATTPAGPSQTAMLSGDFFVSGGQAGYTLPIAVAPGRGGHQPQLSIEYRSDSPNGVMGMGWSIGGLSSIGRCGKNIATDGAWGGVNFNANDRFCLDGQRLIAVSGKDGEHLTEYRLKDNGYSKIVSFGSVGSGPEYFKVWRKDGSVYEYGNTVDSRAELPGSESALRWAVNKIATKANQNSIDFTYHEDLAASSHRINEINYVGGKVVFNYADRPDKTSQYRVSALLKRSQRISAISTFAADGTTDTGKYNFSYDQSSATKRTLLQSIEYCVDANCTTKSEFDWSSQESVTLSNAVATGFKSPRYFDKNRDGVKEVYGVVSSGSTLTVKDLNGATKSSVKSFSLRGSSDNPSIAYNSCSINVAASYMPNSNGSFSNYCQFSSCSSSNGQCAMSSKGTNAGDFNGDGRDTLISGYATIDINGDGIDDKHNFDNSSGGYQFHITDGASGTLPSVPSNYVLAAFTDINNDGYKDVVLRNKSGKSKPYFYLFNGHSYVSRTLIDINTIDTKKLFFADINNDGYPEFFYQGKFYHNNFGSIDLAKVTKSVSVDVSGAQDVNGDGWLDLLIYKSGKTSIQKSTAAVQDKIIRFKEFGVEYRVDYTEAANSRVHTQHPHYVWPIVNSTPRRYLVEKTTKSPLGYQPTETTYHYEGAKSHRKGHGFLGFKKVTETLKSEVETKTITEYFQGESNIELAGKRKSEVIMKNGYKVTSKTFTYTHNERQGNNAKYHQVYASTIVNKNFDLTTMVAGTEKTEKRSTTNIALDRFGNVTKSSTLIASDFAEGGEFKVEKTNQYLSTGINKNPKVYDITTTSNFTDLEQQLSSFNTQLIRYCATDGSVYFKPDDFIVLIHGEVDIPILAKRYDNYFQYIRTDASSSSGGLSMISGDLITVTELEFNAANPKECGSFSYFDYDGNGRVDFSSTTSTHTELVSETGDKYWQVGAVTSSNQTITDMSTSLNRSITNSFRYNALGLITNSETQSTQYELGDSAFGRVDKSVSNRYEYDLHGNVISTSINGTDLTERVFKTGYDSTHALFPISETNALGHKTQFKYDAKTGQLAESISATKGRKTSWNYDGFGRLIQQTEPGLNNRSIVSYKLGSQCLNSTAKTAYCTATTTAENDTGQSIVHYDYAGREIRTLHQAFNGKWVVRDTEWDSSGRKLVTTNPSFLGRQSSNLAKISFTYDAISRVLTKTEPAADGGNAVFTTSYSGLETTLVDARGFSHSTKQNVIGHILKKVEPQGAYQDYTYYPDGKLKTTTDSQGNVTSIRYDNLGYRTYLDDPDMGKWHYTYSVLGELVEKRDANGIKTTYLYDQLGRKVSEASSGDVSKWRYDERDAIGTLSSFENYGNRTDYYYDNAGLVSETAMRVNGEKFSTNYSYDKYERLQREVRPNGVDLTTLDSAGNNVQLNNTAERLAVEYVYNNFGYLSAVRSPKTFADDAFSSASFREEIKQLIKEATLQASQYLAKAEKYATQQQFYANKAAEYNTKTINIHNLEASSLALLDSASRYKHWCNTQGECYLRPATWVMLHDEVTIPLDVTLGRDIFRLETNITSSIPGKRYYNAVLHPVSVSEFDGQALTKEHDYLLTDYDKNGVKGFVSSEDIYVATADNDVKTELLYTADDLDKAATISGTRYQYYTDLAEQLITLVDKVADMSGLYCDRANQLAGGQNDQLTSQRTQCAKTEGTSQVESLNTILTQSQLSDSVADSSNIYYWQRRDTDAYDHTLAETLGNGLVNTYTHNKNTGRPEYIATHKGSQVFDGQLKAATNAGRNLRLIEYRYDDHNNVTMRYDLELGIKDRFEYDGLDRVIKNSIQLDSSTRHAVGNPDLNGPFSFSYDTLGNIKSKTGIGSYSYNKMNAGPHAVTQTNDLSFSYDKVGNLTQANSVTGAIERKIGWNYYNKPVSIERNNNRVDFKYDANHNRYLKTTSDGKETIYVGKKYERTTDSTTGEVQHKHFIYAEGKLIALNTQTQEANKALKDKQVRYLHYDALNSVDMITDGYGNIVEKRSYDVWGKTRKVVWQETSPTSLALAAITNRGYTGHEQIEEVGLVHMNGRVYDQELGRFISADPLIQAPFVTNSFNRYSYVLNNPLKYTDPTGFKFVKDDVNGSYADHKGNTHDRDRWGRPDRDRGNGKGNTPPPPKPTTPNIPGTPEEENVAGGSVTAETFGLLGASIAIKSPFALKTIEALVGIEVRIVSTLPVASRVLSGVFSALYSSKVGAGSEFIGSEFDVYHQEQLDVDAETQSNDEDVTGETDEIGTITTRTSNSTTRLGGKPGEPGVTITYEDGTEFDMTETRVKETEKNKYQPGRFKPKIYEDSLDKQGKKRAPTQEELDWFKDINWN
ncbi:MAG: VCBS repeat-containing protein [Aliivibrio sp.]|uniref:RHS repeat-associated core domain-containing protein n=1 Tax=Aliivibrio sp. TaxID=1872443 RepID=UPI001A4DFD1E|nr:VCBS repeat-containing protein [Aliivibrio sp.]